MADQNEIRREIILKASQERVWAAITDPTKISQWFGTQADFDSLTVGEPIVFGWDDERYQGVIAEVEPPHRFAYRWHSATQDLETPFAELPSTLVTFTLEAVEGGTRLTLVESGFAQLPIAVRSMAFSENSTGWDAELKDLGNYLEG